MKFQTIATLAISGIAAFFVLTILKNDAGKPLLSQILDGDRISVRMGPQIGANPWARNH
jgi:hypothetical protein